MKIGSAASHPDPACSAKKAGVNTALDRATWRVVSSAS